jgi:hypothetical protein
LQFMPQSSVWLSKAVPSRKPTRKADGDDVDLLLTECPTF